MISVCFAADRDTPPGRAAVRIEAHAGDRVIDLEVDGGINFETAPRAVAAGADVLVAGTATFKGGSNAYADNIARLRGGSTFQ